MEFLLSKWVVCGICALLGFIGLVPKATVWVVRQTGKMWWAEERFGQGGTYVVWKIIGILAPIFGIIYLFW